MSAPPLCVLPDADKHSRFSGVAGKNFCESSVRRQSESAWRAYPAQSKRMGLFASPLKSGRALGRVILWRIFYPELPGYPELPSQSRGADFFGEIEPFTF
jgi:hypothetical protein